MKRHVFFSRAELTVREREAKRLSEALAFVLFIASLLLLGTRVLFDGFADSSAPWTLFLYDAAKAAVLLLPCLGVRYTIAKMPAFPPLPKRAFPRRKTVQVTLFSIGFILLLQMLYVALFPAVGATLDVHAETPFLSYVALFLSSVLIPAVTEEFFFRGIVLRGFSGHRHLLAVLASALLFGLMHFSAEAFPLAFLCGLLLGAVYLTTGSLHCSALIHFVCNAVAFASAVAKALNPTLYENLMKLVFAGSAVLIVFGALGMPAMLSYVLGDFDDDTTPAASFWTFPMAVFLLAAVAIQWLS